MWRDRESSQDFLNFTEVADQIATLATSEDLLPVSIGVFGTWGTGKSTVLTLVEQKLRTATPVPIIVQFDAWLYQGYDDAKAALMDVVADRLLAETKSNEGLFEKAKSFASRINYFRALGMAADVGLGLAIGVPPSLLTRAAGAIGSIVSGKGSEKDKGDVQAAGGAAIDAWSDLVRPAQAKSPPKEIAAFRAEFGAILKELKRPLVLFIDNLDRCLPDTAIGTLEAIRLFLFIEGTAFIIAADEDMVRHSVAKHFSDPNARHVKDYLDKVIQVPMYVPQVGTDDLRAYMYSLFVGRFASAQLGSIQAFLLNKLQKGWSGETFARDEIDKMAGSPKGLLDALAVSDRLAPILVTAPEINGNPRIVKRLLNAITLRQHLAQSRGMNVDLATLAKLAVFERGTDAKATRRLYQTIMGADADEALLLLPANAKSPAIPGEWKPHEVFIGHWRSMEPAFNDVKALRPAVFLSRDSMVPAVVVGAGPEAQAALVALLDVQSVNSGAGKKIANGLTPADQKLVMAEIINQLRKEDFSQKTRGVHGAIILAEASDRAELQAFIDTLEVSSMYPATRALLKSKAYISSGD